MITVDWANTVRLIVEVTIKEGYQQDLRKALADFLAATKDYRESCQITPIDRDDEVATTVHDED